MVIPKEFQLNDIGRHNGSLDDASERLRKGRTYTDLSTIWATPTRKPPLYRTISSWIGLQKPMNQQFIGPLFLEGDEVGIAYQKFFEMVLGHEELSKWKYILTVEEDNLPPQMGLMDLYESIEKGYDCVGGLYWTKGECGQPMIYGDPNVFPRNFRPQVPKTDELQHCNGLGMGFNLWRIESFKTKLKDMPKPWFQTVQKQGQQFTQDLKFFDEAAKYGFKVACDTRVKVGHIDNEGTVW